MWRLALVLGYYLSTNFTNPEIGINWLDTMLTLVRCDVNTPDKLFAKKRKKKKQQKVFQKFKTDDMPKSFITRDIYSAN